jgi:hypothetical protein
LEVHLRPHRWGYLPRTTPLPLDLEVSMICAQFSRGGPSDLSYRLPMCSKVRWAGMRPVMIVHSPGRDHTSGVLPRASKPVRLLVWESTPRLLRPILIPTISMALVIISSPFRGADGAFKTPRACKALPSGFSAEAERHGALNRLPTPGRAHPMGPSDTRCCGTIHPPLKGRGHAYPRHPTHCRG